MFTEYQVNVVKAITSGSLVSLRRLVIGTYDIDKFVCPHFFFNP